MKKCLSFLFAVLLLISFSACNGNPQETNSEPTESTNTEKTESEATENANADKLVDKIYDDFLSGKITAAYADGTDIYMDDLEKMATPHTITYGLLDRNGDSVPELCINNGLYITTFWVSDGILKLWREENTYSKILSNGNCLETHYGGAPNHTDYSYNVYSYTGRVVCSVTFSVLIKNGVDVLEDMYVQHTYIYNGSAQETPKSVEISKEQFDKGLDSIEKIGEANIVWKSIN